MMQLNKQTRIYKNFVYRTNLYVCDEQNWDSTSKKNRREKNDDKTKTGKKNKWEKPAIE